MKQHWLEPDWKTKSSIQDLHLLDLSTANIEAIILDVDGTLLSRQEIKPVNSVIKWIERAKQNFQIQLVSNNPSRKRISLIGKELGLNYIYGASKPRRHSIQKVLNDFKLHPSKVAIIGDRLFTDVLVGNRLGLYTILVKPLGANGEPRINSKGRKLEEIMAKVLGAKNI